MVSIAKKSLLWVTVAFLCLVLFLASRNGAAQLFLLSARADMDRWSEQRRAPTASEAATVMTQLGWAVRLTDSDPNVHETIARLNLIRAFYSPDTNQREQILREGLEQIHISLTLSPSSPYRWTLLLILKRDLGEYDAEFRQALRRAVELGPWEPTLLLAQANVGLSAWGAMPEEERAMIQQVFVRGMKHQSQAMMGVIRSYRPACAKGMTCQ